MAYTSPSLAAVLAQTSSCNALLLLSFVASLLALSYFVTVRFKSRLLRARPPPPPPIPPPPPHAPPLSPFPPPAPFSAQRLALATNLIVHAAHANATRFTHTLPTTTHVEDVMRRLQSASCAVVGELEKARLLSIGTNT